MADVCCGDACTLTTCCGGFAKTPVDINPSGTAGTATRLRFLAGDLLGDFVMLVMEGESLVRLTTERDGVTDL